MELTGLEPRRSDLARGIVIARSKAPLDPAAQDALWASLAAAGITETERRDTDGDKSKTTSKAEVKGDLKGLPYLGVKDVRMLASVCP